MEALMRTNPKLTIDDFRARTICQMKHRGVEGNWTGQGKDPLVPYTTLSMRVQRWRIIGRCIAWKRGNQSLRAYMLGFMTPGMIEHNTTRGLKDAVPGSGEFEKIQTILKKADSRVRDQQQNRAITKEASGSGGTSGISSPTDPSISTRVIAGIDAHSADNAAAATT